MKFNRRINQALGNFSRISDESPLPEAVAELLDFLSIGDLQVPEAQLSYSRRLREIRQRHKKLLARYVVIAVHKMLTRSAYRLEKYFTRSENPVDRQRHLDICVFFVASLQPTGYPSLEKKAFVCSHSYF